MLRKKLFLSPTKIEEGGKVTYGSGLYCSDLQYKLFAAGRCNIFNTLKDWSERGLETGDKVKSFVYKKKYDLLRIYDTFFVKSKKIDSADYEELIDKKHSPIIVVDEDIYFRNKEGTRVMVREISKSKERRIKTIYNKNGFCIDGFSYSVPGVGQYFKKRRERKIKVDDVSADVLPINEVRIIETMAGPRETRKIVGWNKTVENGLETWLPIYED